MKAISGVGLFSVVLPRCQNKSRDAADDAGSQRQGRIGVGCNIWGRSTTREWKDH